MSELCNCSSIEYPANARHEPVAATAYVWPVGISKEEAPSRLLDLNCERAAAGR
jgi:hypothetical protein